ncbi:MAG: hypothetical protein R2939_07120 [Kofleriaceae bacterium]
MRVASCLFASCLLGVIACGEVASQPDAPVVDAPQDPCGGTEVAAGDVLGCVADGYCAALRRCGLIDVGDVSCRQLPGIDLDLDLDLLQADEAIAALLAAGRVTYAPSAGAACLAELEDASCKELIYVSALGELCPLFTGTVAAGGSCFLDAECAPEGSVCAPIGMVSGGAPPDCTVEQTCRAPSARDASCEGGLRCEPGDHCVALPGDDQCRSGELNAQCSDDDDCDTDFVCLGGDGAGGGACVAAQPANGPCTTERDCAGDLGCTQAGTCAAVDVVGAPCGDRCGNGLRCHPVGHVCAPFAAEGDPCTVDTDCQGGIAPLLSCDDHGTAATDDDTCEGPGDLDEPCTDASECDLGLHCSNAVSGAPMGTCTGPRPDGAACNLAEQCASGYCLGGECNAYPVCAGA